MHHAYRKNQLKSHLSPFPFVDAECCSDWRIPHSAALISDIPASEFSLVQPMNSTDRQIENAIFNTCRGTLHTNYVNIKYIIYIIFLYLIMLSLYFL